MKHFRLHFPYTIKVKFLILAVSVTVLPLIVIAVFSYNSSYEIINKKVSASTANLLSVVNWNINMIIGDIEDISNVILISRDIQENLSASAKNGTSSFEKDSKIKDILISITNNKQYINTVFIGNESMSYFQAKEADPNERHIKYQDVLKTNWYRNIKYQNGKGVWHNGNDLDLFNENLLLYGKLIKNVNTLKPIGVLAIGINKSVFANMFSNLNQTQDSQILILNGDEVVYFNNLTYSHELLNEKNIKEFSSLGKNGSTLKKIENKDYLVSYSTNINTGWKVISMMPNDRIMKESRTVKNLTIIIAGISFLVALVGTFFITSRITRQLKLLRHVIRQIGNREDISNVHFDQKDEVGEIGNEFLKMVKDNEELNINLYKAIVKEKEAELMALQSQINPHFLYNTLDSIFWMAEKIKAKNISRMVICLSRLFKLNLNNGEKITTVKNEFDQISSYLEIQNIRYSNKFLTDINLDPALLEYKMLKLLIQPIVENAIYHGLELKEDTGHIRIEAKEENDNLIFIISDDGIGFDSEQVLINNKGYALKNVNERIKLFYGQEYGITINSEKDRGTEVIINIKKIL